jgi:hypothetical protein
VYVYLCLGIKIKNTNILLVEVENLGKGEKRKEKYLFHLTTLKIIAFFGNKSVNYKYYNMF